MKVAIGSDHAGYSLKGYITEHLEDSNIEVLDYGTHSEESIDYPRFAHSVANSVSTGEVDYGILICGSANGVSMTANKHAKIRCAICWKPELATLAKSHNNANIIALPARFISEELAVEIINAYRSAQFEGGRHQRRVEKIPCT
ncbi:MAG: ribose 5-phosphate isomerase B [Flavobacteriales bacterium]|nr:ribose 5-phosphate isomerase B [Flavobacteriales bacterium]